MNKFHVIYLILTNLGRGTDHLRSRRPSRKLQKLTFTTKPLLSGDDVMLKGLDPDPVRISGETVIIIPRTLLG